MKLKCPECSQHFVIAPTVIGPNGRTVRCSACTTTWFVASEPDVLDLYEQMGQDQVGQNKTRQNSNLGAAYGTDPEADPAYGNLHPSAPEALAAAASLGVPENNLEHRPRRQNKGKKTGPQTPHAQMRDRAERKKIRRRLVSVAMIWGVTLAIIALVGLAAYVMRSTIVEKFPQTRLLYQSFKIKVPIGGLEIYDVQTKYAGPVGGQTIYVEGKLKNVDRKTRDVPLLRLSFKNGDGKILDQWVVEPSKSELAGGEILVFKTHFQNPPIQAISLATNFVFEAIETELGNGSVPSQEVVTPTTQEVITPTTPNPKVNPKANLKAKASDAP